MTGRSQIAKRNSGGIRNTWQCSEVPLNAMRNGDEQLAKGNAPAAWIEGFALARVN